MINEERLVSFFKELCLIDAPALCEADCAKVVKAKLESLGLEVWEDTAGLKIGGNANNVFGRLRATNPNAPRLFLCAHMDTVEPTAGLVIGERDGVLFSESDTILGADDKAGLAPAIEAVECLLESGEPHGEVTLIFTCAEEIGLKGAGVVDLSALDVDFGYVLDTGPPVGTFVTNTATHDKLDVVVIGRPAHAGKHPEEGLNAIEVVSRAISKMRLGRISPNTTANFGLIEGGTAVNVVCPFVKLKGEARSTVVKELEDQIDHMVSTFEAEARAAGAELKIEHKRHYDAYNISEDAPVVALARRAAESLGMPGTLRTTLGGSDANVFNAKGVPTIVLGTGMEQIHTHDEHVSISDLVDTARVSLEILLEAGRA